MKHRKYEDTGVGMNHRKYEHIRMIMKHRKCESQQMWIQELDYNLDECMVKEPLDILQNSILMYNLKGWKAAKVMGRTLGK